MESAMITGEMPLLLDCQFYHVWGNSYEKYYKQKGGRLYSIIPFSANVQLGQGRNSATLILFNFGIIVSWNAQFGRVPAQAQGPQIEMRCSCGATATAMTPICEDCAQKLIAGVT